LKKSGGFFDLAAKKAKLDELSAQMESDPSFWDDAKASGIKLKEKKRLESELGSIQSLESLLSDWETALELSQEESEYLTEADDICTRATNKVAAIRIQAMLSGELDNGDVLLSINAGAGGTESCDWTSMIMRMYLRYIEDKEWSSNIISITDGDGAGIKSVDIEVSGDFAYGLLKSEAGVHRLVRVSPFDSNARRHTSFCSVSASPIVDDDIEIEINPADLKVDTYRASGAGGQHVNKTDSAVRITHAPSGIVVQCQSQRSQHQNRDKAMQLLKSKLYEAEIAKRTEAKQNAESAKSDISFGHQIRSYILHPYKMVKDHRTGIDVHNPDKVLDGDIEKFISSYLLTNA